MERMQIEASKLGAEGIVGVNVKEQSHGWESHVIEYFSVGTAVTPAAPAVDDTPTLHAPTVTLSVNG